MPDSIRMQTNGVSLLMGTSIKLRPHSRMVMNIYPESENHAELERLRVNTVYPSLRVVQNLARKYMGCSVQNYGQLGGRLGQSLECAVGVSPEHQAAFFAAFVIRTKIKQ